MGEIENASRRRARKALLQEIILNSVATAGLLGMVLVAPNAIQALAKLGIVDTKKRRGEYINRARNRLIDAGMLSRDAQGFLRITTKGELRLRHLERANYQIKRPRRWDHKWRMLVFDIPEYRRSLRDKVRNTLVSIGFVHLQHSVWVNPYPCDDFIALLKADLKIGKNLLYVITDSIENDKFLQKKFGLSTE